MSTSGTPTGVMRFKMEVMKKDNYFTNISPPNVIKRCLTGRYTPEDTIHPPGCIRYIDANGLERIEERIDSSSGVITIYATEILDYSGINFITCPE